MVADLESDPGAQHRRSPYRWVDVSIPPDDMRRSPTGRVPEWVRAEASGLPMAPTEWRTAVYPGPYDRRPEAAVRSSTWLWVVAMLAAALLVILGMQWWAGIRNAAPLGTAPVPEATSTSYAFLDTQETAKGQTVPVAWSPCRPIHVVVDASGAPKEFVPDVVASLGAVSLATGLVFAIDGLTTEPATTDRASFQPTRYGDRWAPVLVRFADADAVPELDGDVVRLTTTQAVGDRRSGLMFYVSATVYLDTTMLKEPDFHGVPVYVPVLRHVHRDAVEVRLLQHRGVQVHRRRDVEGETAAPILDGLRGGEPHHVSLEVGHRVGVGEPDQDRRPPVAVPGGLEGGAVRRGRLGRQTVGDEDQSRGEGHGAERRHHVRHE